MRAKTEAQRVKVMTSPRSEVHTKWNQPVLEIRSGALWFVSKLGDLGQKWPRPPPGAPMTAGFGAQRVRASSFSSMLRSWARTVVKLMPSLVLDDHDAGLTNGHFPCLLGPNPINSEVQKC
jgi:hypothetical protein